MRHLILGTWLFVLAPVAHAQTTVAPSTGIGQMLAGLAAVIALVFALAWVARRLGVQGQAQSPLLRRIAVLQVGTRERVMIVEAGEQWLVLGVTAHSIQTLHTLPKGSVPDTPAIHFKDGFAALLQRAGKKHAPQ